MSKKRKYKIYKYTYGLDKYSVWYNPAKGWIGKHNYSTSWVVIRRTKEKAIKDVVKQVKDYIKYIN